MSTETKGLRTAPLTMLVSLLVGACAHVMFFGRSGADHWNPRLMFAVGGFRCAEVALGVFAAMELVKRTNGRVALGARIALGGYAALCAWFVINQLINFDPTQLRKEWVGQVFRYGWPVWGLCVVAGFTVMVWRGQRLIAIAIAVIGVLANPPPALGKLIYEPLHLTFDQYEMLDHVMEIALRAMFVVAFYFVARRPATPDPTRAANGLRACSRSLWLRVMVAVVVTMAALLLIGARPDSSEEHVVRFAKLGGAIVVLVGFAWFGIGVLRAATSGVSELSALPLVLAGAGILWVGGVALCQLPFLYNALYRPEWGFNMPARYESTVALALPSALVALTAVGLVAISIGRLATQRNDEDLLVDAQGKGVGYVVTMLVAVSLEFWMVPEAKTAGSLVMLMILAAVAALVATGMMARLCAAGAEALDGMPRVPTASVVSG